MGLFLLVFAALSTCIDQLQREECIFAVPNLSSQRFSSEFGAVDDRNELAQLNLDELDFLIGGKGR